MRVPVALLACGTLVAVNACDFSSSRPQPAYPDQKSQAFHIYARNCSGCHVPPLPDAHSAVEWQGVIYRMQQHRLESRMPAIKPQAMGMIRDYLVAHTAVE